MTSPDIFFALLRSALIVAPLSKEERACVEETLSDVCRIASKHDALHLIAYALQKEGISAPAPIEEKLLREQMLAVYRYERLAYELSRVCALLDEEGVDYVPLKGAVLRSLYPEPYLRTSCDIDLLVREENHALVTSLLKERLSYTSNDVRTGHDVSLYSPGGVHLELHFSIKESVWPMDGVLARVWEYTSPVLGARHEMSDEYLAFHLIAHAAFHFRYGGCGVRPFIDLYLLLQKRALSRGVLEELLREAGLSAFGEAAVSFGRVYFEGEEMSETVREMTAFLLGGGLYGSFENAVAMYGKSRKRYLLGRIFPSKKTLESRYPSLVRRPYLYPVFLMKRWIAVFLVGSRRWRNAAKEFRTSSRVDDEKRARLCALTSSLGLDF